MANVLTGIRMLCGILILTVPTFSGRFYCLYLLGGLTDAVDGTVARRTGQASAFGAEFDTAADILFAAGVLIKLFTDMDFPLWVLIWAGAVVLLKLANIVLGLKKYRRFITVHSKLNKACGACVFLLPLCLGSTLPEPVKTAALSAACVLTSAAAVCELVRVRTGKGIG